MYYEPGKGFCGSVEDAHEGIPFFDEPTSGLDFSHMMQTAEILKKLKSKDAFIFVITHDYEFILSGCDNVVHIEQGSIAEQYELDKEGMESLKKFFEFD